MGFPILNERDNNPHFFSQSGLDRRSNKNRGSAFYSSEVTKPTHLIKNDRQYIEDIIKEIRRHLTLADRKFSYSRNEEIGQTIIKILDTETDEVIRELPPQEMQRIRAYIREAVGLFVDEEI